MPTRIIEHLIVLRSLAAAGDFGDLSCDGDDFQRWAQAKRRAQGWIVEVRDCTIDDWPQRIHPAATAATSAPSCRTSPVPRSTSARRQQPRCGPGSTERCPSGSRSPYPSTSTT